MSIIYELHTTVEDPKEPKCHCKSFIYSNTLILQCKNINYITMITRVLLVSVESIGDGYDRPCPISLLYNKHSAMIS